VRDEERRARIDASVAQWGSGAVPAALAPSKANDPAFLEWAGRMERYSASPGTISKIMGAIGETDVRHVLPSIRVPTLIMHRRQDPFLMVEHGRYLAEHIPGSRYVELEGSATAAGRSSRPGTGSWPPSTVPRGRSARPPRSGTRSAAWASRAAPACTPASAR